MSAPEYLTIKDFAKAAKVTPQRIYKLLSKDNGLSNGLSNRLKPYIKIENNQKYLNIRALELFEKNETSQPVEQQIEQRVESVHREQTAQAAIAALEKQLEVLQQQLTVKDKQIEQLTAALQAAQEQQTALTTALSQQQALHAGDIQRQLTEHSGSSERMPEREPEISDPEEPEQPKQSWFARIFKRK